MNPFWLLLRHRRKLELSGFNLRVITGRARARERANIVDRVKRDASIKTRLTPDAITSLHSYSIRTPTVARARKRANIET
jgi:hypothetical protein